MKRSDNTFDYFDVSSGSVPSPGVAKSSDSGGAFNRTQVAISSDSGGDFNRTRVAVCVGPCTLVFVRELGAIDNASYRAINRADTLNASSHLRRLRDLNLLEMKGSGSRIYYVPGPGFQQKIEPVSTPVGTNSHQVVPDSHQLLVTIPAELRERIPPQGSKPRRETLRLLILDLCRWQALSAREIAAILGGRESKVLVRDYLSPMVDEGLLRHTIPEMENHPDQRYTSPAD